MSLPLCVKNVIIQQLQNVVNCFLVRPEEFESPTSRLRRPVFYPVELETHCNWCHELDSNQPHTDFQSAALPDELPRQILVSIPGFEPRPYRPKRQVQPDNTLRRLNEIVQGPNSSRESVDYDWKI